MSSRGRGAESGERPTPRRHLGRALGCRPERRAPRLWEAEGRGPTEVAALALAGRGSSGSQEGARGQPYSLTASPPPLRSERQLPLPQPQGGGLEQPGPQQLPRRRPARGQRAGEGGLGAGSQVRAGEEAGPRLVGRGGLGDGGPGPSRSLDRGEALAASP